MTLEQLGHAHVIRVCQHDTVVSQCSCPGAKSKILVPCPASCAEEGVELHPKFYPKGELTPQGQQLVHALTKWIERAEYGPGVVKGSAIIEAIENQGWRLTYVGKEE